MDNWGDIQAWVVVRGCLAPKLSCDTMIVGFWPATAVILILRGAAGGVNEQDAVLDSQGDIWE